MRLGKLKLFERRLIGYGKNPLLIRWILFRVPSFGIYVHKLLRSDYDRALHDHPWPFISIVLSGGYWEEHDQTISGEKVSIFNPPWKILLRPAEWRHRVEIFGPPAWTLVLVGRRSRMWGFWLPDGWCWWRQHNQTLNICEEEVIHEEGSD